MKKSNFDKILEDEISNSNNTDLNPNKDQLLNFTLIVLGILIILSFLYILNPNKAKQKDNAELRKNNFASQNSEEHRFDNKTKSPSSLLPPKANLNIQKTQHKLAIPYYAKDIADIYSNKPSKPIETRNNKIYTLKIDAKSGPWDINANKAYSYDYMDSSPPVIIKVKSGNKVKISYLKGYANSDYPNNPDRITDAGGYSKSMITYLGQLPSFYINENINHMALLGTFGDSNRVIVGSPFFIGKEPIDLVVPKGATQIQLGVNDNRFSDNAGWYLVRVEINTHQNLDKTLIPDKDRVKNQEKLNKNNANDVDFVPYMRELQRRIKRNWHPPRRDESKRVQVLFKLNKKGDLLRLNISKSSGNIEADDAALEAIKMSAPFRPLPPEYQGSDIDIQFTFDYNVFNKN